MTNYYNILGLETHADKQEIKVAYRKLSKKFHPDLNPDDPFLHKMFLQVQEAYDILSDVSLRSKYDKILFNWNQPNHIGKNINNDIPIINNFSVDKDEIIPEEVFTVTWKVSNADVIQIRPLGLFPKEGFEKFKFDVLKSESINLVLIATNSTTGLSARKHLELINKAWKPSFFQDNKKMDLIILVIKILFVLLLLVFLIMLIQFGIQIDEPLKNNPQ